VGFTLYWIASKLVEGVSGIHKARVVFVGISIASLVVFVSNLALFARRGESGSWVIVTYQGPPYIGIMGVPFTTIIWSLFLGSFFAALERILKLWEESQER